MAAGRLAWQDARLSGLSIPPDRVGICAGSTIGSPDEIYSDQHERFLKKGPRGVSPFSSAEYTPHAATARTAIELGIKGRNHTISTGCSTALDALGWGTETIRDGILDVALVGAADSVLTPFCFATLDVLGILSDDNDHPESALRPYDRLARGSVASEGGGMFVLESLDHARKRGARIYAKVVAYASANESSHMIMDGQAPDTIARAIHQAMERAQIKPSHVDYICAHGVGIPHYDVGETTGFKKALGDEAYRIPVSSIKALTGQAYAGGGAFQIAAAANAVRLGIIPPTCNHDEPGPGCDLDYVPAGPRRNNIEYCLLNSQSVGGSHSVVILRRADA
jgi:3-oxoacyl-(acyl-carrier-protein) synthase